MQLLSILIVISRANESKTHNEFPNDFFLAGRYPI